MENNKNKKSVKFQGDMLNFCDFIQVFVFTRNHHLNGLTKCNLTFSQIESKLFSFIGSEQTISVQECHHVAGLFGQIYSWLAGWLIWA